MHNHHDLFIAWIGTTTAVVTTDLSATVSLITSLFTITFTGIRLYHELKNKNGNR